jgi:hypothetical protein
LEQKENASNSGSDSIKINLKSSAFGGVGKL